MSLSLSAKVTFVKLELYFQTLSKRGGLENSWMETGNVGGKGLDQWNMGKVGSVVRVKKKGSMGGGRQMAIACPRAPRGVAPPLSTVLSILSQIVT